MFALEKLKDVLVGSLGVVGYVIWKFLLYVFYFFPVFCLELPLWLDILISLAILYIPIIGNFLYFAAWVWSFIIVLSNPINWFSVVYFIMFGIYILTGVLPFIINIILSLFDE